MMYTTVLALLRVYACVWEPLEALMAQVSASLVALPKTIFLCMNLKCLALVGAQQMLILFSTFI